jgi:hypothetical protein
MKIQDLRDDLAEMRYFKKSHLRKMSQQEAGDVKPVHPFPNPYQFPPEAPDWSNPNYNDPDGDGMPEFFPDNPYPPSNMDILQVFIDNLHRIM